MTFASDTLIAFVNERAVRVPRGASAADAVRAHDDPALAEALAAGRARLTDGRGIGIESEGPVGAGDIIRVVVSARQARESDADA